MTYHWSKGLNQRLMHILRASLYYAIISLLAWLPASPANRKWLPHLLAGTALYAEDDGATAQEPINLLISINWEGDQINNYNLSAIRQMRRQFRSLRIVHFIDPSYFTKPGANPQLIRAQILSVMAPGDEIGLQLYPWKSLVQKAGIIFRDSPTIWGYELAANDCTYDCGHEVPLTAYNKEEQGKLVEAALKVFAENGFNKPISFRAGAWMETPDLREVIAAHGFRYDFSAVSPYTLKNRLERYPLFEWLVALWHQTTPYTQPYPIMTPAGELIEIVSNTGTTEFVTDEDAGQFFRAYAELQKSKPRRPLYFQLSLHQETAAESMPRLISSIQEIFDLSQELGVTLRSLSLPGTPSVGPHTPRQENTDPLPMLNAH